MKIKNNSKKKKIKNQSIIIVLQNNLAPQKWILTKKIKIMKLLIIQKLILQN